MAALEENISKLKNKNWKHCVLPLGMTVQAFSTTDISTFNPAWGSNSGICFERLHFIEERGGVEFWAGDWGCDAMGAQRFAQGTLWMGINKGYQEFSQIIGSNG